MIAAFACYENRLAALLDTAVQFQLYRLENGCASELERLTLPGNQSPSAVIEALTRHSVDIVVCGAVSDQVVGLLSRSRIELFPWVCGELQPLSQALARGSLQAFAMPGCCGRRRQGRGEGGFRHSWINKRSDS